MPTTIKNLAEWERPDWIAPSNDGVYQLRAHIEAAG
jgi:hypothetical protein